MGSFAFRGAAVRFVDVKFHEKLKRRVEEGRLNKARAARDVGLPESTISSYLAKTDSLPRADIALKIARAIEVPVEWLIDDEQEWPPPTTPTKNSLSDHELMSELSDRFLRAVHEYIDAQQVANSIDWARAAKEAESLKLSDPLPPYSSRATSALAAVNLKFSRMQQDFDVREFALLRLDRRARQTPSVEEIDAALSAFPFGNFDERADVARFHRAVKDHPGWKDSAQRHAANQMVALGRQWANLVAEKGKRQLSAESKIRTKNQKS